MKRPLSALLLILLLIFVGDQFASADPQQDESIVETIIRLPNFDIASSAKAKAAVLRYLERNRGSQRYFELVKRLPMSEVQDELLALALEKHDQTAGVTAATLLLAEDEAALRAAITSDDDSRTVRVIGLLRRVGSPTAWKLIEPLVIDSERSFTVRSAASKALGHNAAGQQKLLDWAKSQTLPGDLRLIVAGVLHSSTSEAIRTQASSLFPAPAGADEKPLPPLSELIKLRGDPRRGRKLYFDKATCSKCHQIGSEGTEVGPALTEIGSKLAREAAYVAILDPSAGISHNYESYVVLLADGTTATGLLISQTDEKVTIKTAEGIEKTFSQDEIDEVIKQKTSLMPSGLQKLITVEELADVIEYLLTLKKSEP